MDKRLIILRGLPGAGKSTLAQAILAGRKYENWFEADMFFEHHYGEYKFDPSMLGAAHGWCKLKVETAMMNDVSPVIVSNTFTTEKELAPYLELANKYGYGVTCLIVENRHGNPSVHNVPAETMDKMFARFSFRLM